MPPIWKPRMLLGIALLALLAAQLVPVDRSSPPVSADLPTPPDVKEILQRSCYTCHSHETVWPWYGYVAPLSWLFAWDLHDARDKMNFSSWNAYRLDERDRLLKEVLEEIDEENMPPRYFRLLHPGARMTESELERLRAWVRARRPRG